MAIVKVTDDNILNILMLYRLLSGGSKQTVDFYDNNFDKHTFDLDVCKGLVKQLYDNYKQECDKLRLA